MKIKPNLITRSLLLTAVTIFLLSNTLEAKEAEEDYAAMTRLGIMYQDNGDRAGAMRLFKNAIKVNPDYPFAHFFLGRLHFLMQKEDDAASEFDIFRKKMNLSQDVSEEMKKEYTKKLSYISEVYFTLKRYPEMKEVIGEILGLDPANQDAHYNLGVYYYTYEHNRSRAYQLFNKVVEIDPATSAAKNSKYAIEFMRNNPDPRVAPDFSFIDQEYRK